MVSVSPRRIPLSEINQQDDSFRISTTADKDDTALTRSLTAVGLLTSPLVRPGPDQGFQIVTGFRRVAVLESLGHDAISCRELDAGTNDITCLQIAVADNASQRPLNLVEQARTVQKLTPFFDAPTKLCQVLADLGLSASPAIVGKLQTIAALPDGVLDGIAKDEIPLSVATELARLDDTAAATLAAVFTRLRLGVNKQREVLTMVREIAAREKRSIQAVLETDEVGDVLENQDLDRGRKAARLREVLTHRRFPAIAQTREAFREAVQAMKLGKCIDLYPPENFESTYYTLQLRFKSMDELASQKAEVDKVVASEALKRLMET
ncbi:MAG: ParB N-terminal domain-containing protein [Thermodesulfobacteriota bacterium]|nr:ParB N-terminal domain-containing protein [Thermodesulfobacteriota bacterium]